VAYYEEPIEAYTVLMKKNNGKTIKLPFKCYAKTTKISFISEYDNNQNYVFAPVSPVPTPSPSPFLELKMYELFFKLFVA
jgi:hypothetical protein